MAAPSQSQERLTAALSYILFIIPMVMGVQTEYTMFHARQSFMLFLVWIVLVILTWMFLNGFGVFLIFLLGLVALWCLYQAYLGNRFVLPWLGERASSIITKLGLSQFFIAK